MHDAKVGIKSCRGARECVSFVHVRTYVCSYSAAILCILLYVHKGAIHSVQHTISCLYIPICVDSKTSK